MRRNLCAPAIIFLEMHKPLASIGAQAALATAPFTVPFFGFEAINNYSRLFSNRQNVEKLLLKIEELSKPQSAKDE